MRTRITTDALDRVLRATPVSEWYSHQCDSAHVAYRERRRAEIEALVGPAVLVGDAHRRGLWWLLDPVRLSAGYGRCGYDAEALALRAGLAVVAGRAWPSGEAYWTTRAVTDADRDAMASACPYRLTAERGKDYAMQRNALRVEMGWSAVGAHHCVARPKTPDAERALRSGASHLGYFAECAMGACPRLKGDSDRVPMISPADMIRRRHATT